MFYYVMAIVCSAALSGECQIIHEVSPHRHATLEACHAAAYDMRNDFHRVVDQDPRFPPGEYEIRVGCSSKHPFELNEDLMQGY